MPRDKPPDCRCNTGAYCRLHRRYIAPTRLNLEAPAYQAQMLRGYYVKDGYQRCGGGRRIIRKKMGDI